MRLKQGVQHARLAMYVALDALLLPNLGADVLHQSPVGLWMDVNAETVAAHTRVIAQRCTCDTATRYTTMVQIVPLDLVCRPLTLKR